MRLPWWLSGKKSACNVEDLVLIPGLRGFPGGGLGNSVHGLAMSNPVSKPIPPLRPTHLEGKT